MSSLYFQMLRIRMIEEAIAKRYPEQKMRCPVHLSIGQEAAAVGLCAGLKPEDKMVSTHRGHAHYLAKGGSLKGLIGELYGKSSGCSRGNGGSMHLVDLGRNFYGSTSIVGGTIPVGVGLSFADKLKGSDAVTVVCIGDAAVEEGVFHEAANFAALHGLQVLFALENNQYSCYTHVLARQPNRSFQYTAFAHGLNFMRTHPNDVRDIKEATYAIKLPALLEIPTYRYVQHCGPDNDDHLYYRPKIEQRHWKDLDPLKINLQRGDASDADIGKIQLEIDRAFEDAESAPFPGVEEIGKYVYAPSNV